jgi:hypothetical protein
MALSTQLREQTEQMRGAAGRLRVSFAPRRVQAELDAAVSAAALAGSQLTARVHHALDRIVGRVHALAVKARFDSSSFLFERCFFIIFSVLSLNRPGGTKTGKNPNTSPQTSVLQRFQGSSAARAASLTRAAEAAADGSAAAHAHTALAALVDVVRRTVARCQDVAPGTSLCLFLLCCFCFVVVLLLRACFGLLELCGIHAHQSK